MLMECTDCKHCINFDWGYRIWCANRAIPPSDIYRYQPLGDATASRCIGFEEDDCYHFSVEDLVGLEKFIGEIEDDLPTELEMPPDFYEGLIRDWFEKQEISRR